MGILTLPCWLQKHGGLKLEMLSLQETVQVLRILLARVEIEVRTALFDEATQSIVIDPNVYWETIIPSQTFANNTGFNNGTQITIEVPETGAYSIRYLVEISQCSLCCHGGNDNQCGSNQTANGNGGFDCEAGFPRVSHEDVFLIAERPDHTINYFIGNSKFLVRMCVCGCDVSC